MQYAPQQKPLEGKEKEYMAVIKRVASWIRRRGSEDTGVVGKERPGAGTGDPG